MRISSPTSCTPLARPRLGHARRSDHTCVALLIGKGAQQYEVMEHLGHTNIQFPSVCERIRVALEETWDQAEAVVR